MLIAFEGPDNTGKSTGATTLSTSGQAIYNATKMNHAHTGTFVGPGDVQCFDRIDWFTHMVYRLSMPERDWNDERPRTVFAMPDTHLVVKMHRPDLAPLIDDELYETGKLALVNPMYYYFSDFFMKLNEARDYDLFKTVSIVEVSNDPRDGSFSQVLKAFSSPILKWPGSEHAHTDEGLLELLRYEESLRS